MSSRTGLRRVGDQRLSLRLATLCGPSTLTLNAASRHPTPLVRTVLDRIFAVVGIHSGSADVRVRDLSMDGVPGRLFEPADPGDALLVFFHGGGFILGSVGSHDQTCRFTAARARCRVLSVNYRLAPDAPFPAAVEDSRAAYRWAVAHADELGVRPDRVAVGGDSAGGNLAMTVALDPGEVRPCFAWLIYPLVDGDIDAYPSAHAFAAGPLLSRGAAWDMITRYAPDPSARADPRVSVIDADLADAPPTYVATAGMDPLRDQGERFAERLRAAGVAVEARRFEHLPHGFDLLLVDPSARAATAETCAALKRGLDAAHGGRTTRHPGAHVGRDEAAAPLRN